MSTFALRLPDSLYAHAKLLAEQDQASLNQFITVAVAEKVSALQTAEFFAQRAGQSTKADLAKLLAKVKDRAPVAGDEWHE
jgi:HicB family